MGHVAINRPAVSSGLRVDIPRTTLNIVAVLAIVACIANGVLRITTGQSFSILFAVACIWLIEMVWLMGEAFLLSYRD